jgi:hypothetical protein
MRRSIVPPSLVLAAAAAAVIWILAVSGPATAAPRAPRVVPCPLQSAQALSCCPLPPGAMTSRLQPICCGHPTPCCASTPCCVGSACCPASSGTCCTTTPCPSSSLTIASSPNPSTAGQKVVISGAMTGTPVAGAQVVLWRELAHQSSFQQVAQTTTDSAGDYSFTMQRGAVMGDQAWYVTSNGMQSSTVQQQVAAVVALASSTRSAAVGQAIVLRGHVTPSHAGQVVLLEVRHGSTWQVIARPRLGRGSSYSLSRRFARPGPVVFRAVLPGDSRNARSTSRTVTVTVTH